MYDQFTSYGIGEIIANWFQHEFGGAFWESVTCTGTPHQRFMYYALLQDWFDWCVKPAKARISLG